MDLEIGILSGQQTTVWIGLHICGYRIICSPIPLEECANFTDCESCISYNNPLCGWCTVEDKCSRRSQCQNAAEPVRWVQNSSQCISITITPNQFILDNPEILRVTVTPELPPLLTNESYQCQFADRERLRVITVDAEEVTPTTAYQCNITGRIPTFTGVQLVMDFMQLCELKC